MDTNLLAASQRDALLASRPRAARPFGTPLKRVAFALFATVSIASSAFAGSITVDVPPDLKVDKASITTEKEPKTTIDGTIKDHAITFADPQPGSAYEATLTLKDGTVLQGVDMGWYSRVPDKANAGELTADDRQQMTAVFDVEKFFKNPTAVLLKGNHNRAVMLVNLQRSDFHSDKGDEIIWRPELWYFQDEHGGWEKVQQTDRVLRRERYATHQEYQAVVDSLKWVPELGGLKVTPRAPDLKVTLPANAGVPTFPPTTQPTTKPQVDPQP